MISYHEHNLRERGQMILSRIQKGESCAVVSDAGMPCISDPGEDLVYLCAKAGIPVCVIPGPSAAVSALAVSGLTTTRFTFEGFLSTNRKNRTEHLESLTAEKRTMIFYEAPHKLYATLVDFQKFFGGDRKISLARELTKIYEEVLRFTIDEAVAYYESVKPKGEFVLIVEGKKEDPKTEQTLSDAVLLAKNLIADGMKATEAAKAAAKETAFSKAEIYKNLL